MVIIYKIHCIYLEPNEKWRIIVIWLGEQHSQQLQARGVHEGVGGDAAQAVARQEQVVQAPQPAQRAAANGLHQVVGQVSKEYIIPNIGARNTRENY